MFRRSFTSFAASAAGVTVDHIVGKLKATQNLQPVAAVEVKDISSGCGSFFRVEVCSEAFSGKPLVQQHRMINDALREEIRQIHGLTIVTKTP